MRYICPAAASRSLLRAATRSITSPCAPHRCSAWQDGLTALDCAKTASEAEALLEEVQRARQEKMDKQIFDAVNTCDTAAVERLLVAGASPDAYEDWVRVCAPASVPRPLLRAATHSHATWAAPLLIPLAGWPDRPPLRR